jgi:hypothetical protein
MPQALTPAPRPGQRATERFPHPFAGDDRRIEGDKSDTWAKSVAIQKPEDFRGLAGPKATLWPKNADAEIPARELETGVEVTQIVPKDAERRICGPSPDRGHVGKRHSATGAFCWKSAWGVEPGWVRSAPFRASANGEDLRYLLRTIR